MRTVLMGKSMSEDSESERDIYLEFSKAYQIIDGVIVKILADIIPTLDPQDKNDEFMIRTCKQDLLEYAKYKLGFGNEIDTEQQLGLELLKKGDEYLEQIETWVHLWYSKWVQRTRVVTMKPDCKVKKEDIPKGALFYMKLDEDSRYCLEEDVKQFLVEQGEYACVETIAANTVNLVVNKLADKLTLPLDTKSRLMIMNELFKKLRDYSKITGPIIFIKLSD